MTIDFTSRFTGAGGADIGAKMAGLNPVAGYEYKKWIAEWATKQLGHPVAFQNVLDLKSKHIPYAIVDHASPPCPSFSVANNQKGETKDDIALAEAEARLIRERRSPIYTMENVPPYRKSQSFKIIMKAIEDVYGMGYWYGLVNFADHGVPQTRNRLLVIAHDGFFAVPPPPKVPRTGWFQAVEDIAHKFKDNDLADWQEKRMPSDILDLIRSGTKAILIDSTTSFGKELRMRPADEPSMTMTGGGGGRVHRAMLIADGNGSKANLIREMDQPAWAARASRIEMGRVILVSNGQFQGNLFMREKEDPAFAVTTKSPGAMRAIASADKLVAIVSINVRGFARFQTFPDTYKFPKGKSKATYLIGNAVPSVGYATCITPVVEAWKARSGYNE